MELWGPYDDMGTWFETHAESSAYNALYDRPAVLAALGPVAGLRVLDAACGPGLYAEALLAAGAEVAAFDASAAMLELARARLGDRTDVLQTTLDAPLPYADASFDSAICALAIHYVEDRPAAYAEFYRVLRAGGRLVVSTQHPTIDWLRKGGSYFDVVLETDMWHLPTGDVPVQFWREPITAVCAAATGAGFFIEQLLEPRPQASMRESFPADFERLEREPGFLILVLRKPL